MVVYHYGCPRTADRVPDNAMEQLVLANRLWNRLVEIDRAHEQVVAQIWAGRPEVAEAAARAEECEDEFDALMKEAAEARRQGRSRHLPAELRERVKDVRARRRALREELRVAKDAAYAELKPRFAEAKAAMLAELKATYAEYVQQEGLYWATYGHVRSGYDTAVASVASARRQGRAAQLRFHRFRGEGTWTAQLQRHAHDPVRSWSALVSGDSRWRNVVRIGPAVTDVGAWSSMSRSERRAAARTTISVRVGSDGRRQPVWLTVPVSIHQPVPADADIVLVQVTRRRIGTHFRTSVSFTCRVGSVEQSERPGAVAVDLGWRRTEDGGIRVAVWKATQPAALVLPGWVRPWVREQGGTGELRVPLAHCEQAETLRKVQSLRDDKLNGLRAELVAWLQAHPKAAGRLEAAPADVAKWRSPSRFAALAIRWRDDRQAGDKKIVARLEGWRRQERRLYERVANTSHKLAGRRREAYRVLAAQLCRAYGTVVVEDMAIPKLTRPGPAEAPTDQQADLARRQAGLAAPGLFRSVLATTAKREGVRFVVAPAAGTTSVHNPCGTHLDQSAARSVTMWCPVCEVPFDQDENAAENLLAALTRTEAAGRNGEVLESSP